MSHGVLFLIRPRSARPPGLRASGRLDSSRLARGIDGALTALEVTRVVTDVAANDSVFANATISRGADIGLGLLFGGLFLTSAIYGFHTTAKCSAALRGHVDEVPTDSEPSGSSHSASAAPEPAAETQVNPGPAPTKFDTHAARIAIAKALAHGQQACGARGGLRGQSAFTLTYQPDGHVSEVLVTPPVADDGLEACLVNSMREASISAYDGNAVVVKKHFDFGEGPNAISPGLRAADAGADASGG